jgi:very-short-patch-repair endonuclease
MLGRKHSIESKIKIGLANSIALKGRHVTDEVKLKISKNNARYWKGKQLELSKNKTSFFYSVSKSEAAFGDLIYKKFGVILEPQFWINNKCFDYKIPYKNIIIECDGSYWHDLPLSIKNDKLKDEIADRNGFKLIRYKINTVADAKRIIEENATEIKQLLQQ